MSLECLLNLSLNSLEEAIASNIPGEVPRSSYPCTRPVVYLLFKVLELESGDYQTRNISSKMAKRNQKPRVFGKSRGEESKATDHCLSVRLCLNVYHRRYY